MQILKRLKGKRTKWLALIAAAWNIAVEAFPEYLKPYQEIVNALLLSAGAHTLHDAATNYGENKPRSASTDEFIERVTRG